MSRERCLNRNLFAYVCLGFYVNLIVFSLNHPHCCCSGDPTATVPVAPGSSSVNDWSSNSAACVSINANTNCASTETECEIMESIGEHRPPKSASEQVAVASSSNAIVLYSPPILESFYLNSRTFHLAGRDFVINQNWAEFGVAAVVWDAAVVLCEFLESQNKLGQLLLKGKQVIELGAGTGLVGMAAATLHGITTITDRESVLGPLRENVFQNFESSSPSSEAEPVSSRPKVQALDWGKNLHEYSEPFDVILGADIIYLEETFPALLQTIDHLSDEKTLILISCRIRYERDERFLKMLSEKFEVQKVHHDSERGIQIYSSHKLER